MSVYYKKNRKTRTEWLRHEGIKESREVQFIKRQLINSKGNICGICGEPIEDMKECTVDHIKPVSKGGLTTVDNCRLAHRECNRLRGNSD